MDAAFVEGVETSLVQRENRTLGSSEPTISIWGHRYFDGTHEADRGFSPVSVLDKELFIDGVILSTLKNHLPDNLVSALGGFEENLINERFMGGWRSDRLDSPNCTTRSPAIESPL